MEVPVSVERHEAVADDEERERRPPGSNAEEEQDREPRARVDEGVNCRVGNGRQGDER
jgi:hypothetical protein